MFSQEDLEAYNRVQNAVELQRQLQNQGPTRGRVARIAAWVLLVLFLATTTAAAFLGYNVLYLNNEFLKSQGNFARVVADNNERLQTIQGLNDVLNQANENVYALNRSLDTERNERNAAVAKLNQNVEALAQQVQEERELVLVERKRGNREIEKANGIIADKEERINYYTEVNVGLEESVTQLDASVRRLESTNSALSREKNSLTQANNTLTREKSALSQRNGTLASENRRLTSSVSARDARISTLQSDLRREKAQQVTIPYCSSNYYTVTGGKLSCVARNTSSFQATQVETSSINLPYSGTVNLRINRSGDIGSDRSMEILEHAVKTIEEYMGQSIPLKGNEIRLDFVEGLPPGWERFAGFNDGTYMEILQEKDKDLSIYSSKTNDPLGIIIAHEVAHYYWNDERTWLDEGAAEFLATYSENKRVGRAMTSQNKRCSQAYSISYLEYQKYDKGDDGYTCNYSLGERLFLDLYDQMKEEDFQSAFRSLNASGRNKLGGIHQVRNAFYPGSEWVQEIIDEWYGYREKPEAHWPNGTFLGYMTWEEADGWKLQANRDNEPCATILRLNDQTAGSGYSVRETRDECYYTGEWNGETGDLLVTIAGTTYRAVEVSIDSAPNGSTFSRRTTI